MKKRIATFFFVSSLSGYSTWAIAGLTISALAVIGAAALGVSGVVLASPGLLTAAVFIGGAGLLCSATSFCDIDPVTNTPVPTVAPAPSPVSAPIGPVDPSSAMSISAWCAYAHPGWSYSLTGQTHNCFDPVTQEMYSFEVPTVCNNFAQPEADGMCSVENSFVDPASDGIKLENSASPTAPRLELPSVSSLPPGSYELWPGSGLYGKPGDFIIYDMRESTGEISGTAKTALTENSDGSKFLEIEIIGSSDGGKQRIDVKPDGTRVVTVTRNVSVTDANGDPDELSTAVVTEYSSSGEKVGTSTFTSTSSVNNGPGPFTVADSDGGDGTSISTSPVPGTGTEPGDGTGSCASGDCSTESTQLANKGLLQAIKDFFTGTSTEPGEPSSRTGADIKGASLDGSGAFIGLRGWQLPAHASQCPTSSFAWNGNTYTFDAHCQLANDHFAMFNGVMVLIFSISALFIVLRA